MFKAPQFELPIVDEPFRLVPETTTDGDRESAEARRREADRTEAAKRQADLPEFGS